MSSKAALLLVLILVFCVSYSKSFQKTISQDLYVDIVIPFINNNSCSKLNFLQFVRINCDSDREFRVSLSDLVEGNIVLRNRVNHSSFDAVGHRFHSSLDIELIGVALDGFPIFGTTNRVEFDLKSTLVDKCGGTFGETPLGFGYHYLVMPSCIFDSSNSIQRRKTYISDINELLEFFVDSFQNLILGYTLEGNEIHGPYNNMGLLPSDLDRCGGKYLNDKYILFVLPYPPYVPSKECNLKINIESCPRGTYQTQQAPLGHFYLEGAAYPSLCPNGRYGSAIGLRTALCSGSCDDGYVCPAGSVKSDTLACGNASYYCPSSSSIRLSVDIGYYSVPESVSEELRYQLPCPKGSYCIKGVKFPCPAGRYGSFQKLSSPYCTGECPRGSYCSIGSSYPLLCPAGRFGDSAGLFNDSCSGLCFPGYWCGIGSTSSRQNPCRAGIYGSEYGLTNSNCSVLCNSAFNTSMAPSFCSPRICEEGFYCQLGSFSPRQVECNETSHYCPAGSAFPRPVAKGFYSVRIRLSEVSSVSIDQVPCDFGHYCANGLKNLCPGGRFGGSLSLSSPDCSGSCDEGFFCPPGSVSSTQNPCGGNNVYCPKGSTSPTLVQSGYFSLGGHSGTTRTATRKCYPGTYCLGDGLKRPCAPGRYSFNGSSTSNCDGLCEAGYYCSEASFSPRQKPCPPGRYGQSGGFDSACSGICNSGYYCPENSTSPYQYECGNDYVYCPRGAGVPLQVDMYHFSVGGTKTTRIAQNLCAIGKNIGTPPRAAYRSNICPYNTVYPI